MRTFLASGRHAAATHTDAAATAASNNAVFTGRRRVAAMLAMGAGDRTRYHSLSGARTGANRSANSSSSHSDMPIPHTSQVRQPAPQRLVRAIQA